MIMDMLFEFVVETRPITMLTTIAISTILHWLIMIHSVYCDIVYYHGCDINSNEAIIWGENRVFTPKKYFKLRIATQAILHAILFVVISAAYLLLVVF